MHISLGYSHPTRFMQLFDRPKRPLKNPKTTDPTKKKWRQTMMVPSSGCESPISKSRAISASALASVSVASSIDGEYDDAATAPEVGLINEIPEELSASYRPIPVWGRAALTVGSSAVVTAMSDLGISSTSANRVTTFKKVLKLAFRVSSGVFCDNWSTCALYSMKNTLI
mmetsp:Transcript_30560/g.45213  ORF Transcript_30560/g.45213 Transcript_30560/m.45213 type:complete len:170 (-) Transcript_30560:37-546(-)